MKKENKKEGQKIVIENVTYRFEEAIDSMDQSLKNLNEVLKQQVKLVEIVEKAIVDMEDEKEKKEFEAFVEETKEQIKNLEDQGNNLIYKKALYQKIVDKAHENESNSEYLSLISEALGLFKNR